MTASYGDVLEVAINVYYYLFFVISVPANALMLYLVIRKSPPSLLHFKILLINMAANQICVTALAFCNQDRIITTKDVMAVLPIGLCRGLGPVAAVVSYPIYNALLVNVSLTVGAAMYFRYSITKVQSITRTKVILSLLLSYVTSMCMITPTISQKEYEYVMSVTLAEYPEVASYGPFGGVMTTHFSYRKNTLILIVGSFLLPAQIFYWRCVILKFLNNPNNNLSKMTMVLSKRLVQALFLQGLLPCFFNVPIALCYLISTRLGLQNRVFEYLIMVIPSMPAVLNTLLSLYFIGPYRESLLCMLLRKKEINNARVAARRTSTMF